MWACQDLNLAPPTWQSETLSTEKFKQTQFVFNTLEFSHQFGNTGSIFHTCDSLLKDKNCYSEPNHLYEVSQSLDFVCVGTLNKQVSGTCRSIPHTKAVTSGICPSWRQFLMSTTNQNHSQLPKYPKKQTSWIFHLYILAGQVENIHLKNHSVLTHLRTPISV